MRWAGSSAWSLRWTAAAFVAITPAQEVLGEGFAPHGSEEGS